MYVNLGCVTFTHIAKSLLKENHAYAIYTAALSCL